MIGEGGPPVDVANASRAAKPARAKLDPAVARRRAQARRHCIAHRYRKTVAVITRRSAIAIEVRKKGRRLADAIRHAAEIRTQAGVALRILMRVGNAKRPVVIREGLVVAG